MNSLKELFDIYSRNARLQPTLFVILPLLATMLVWIPSVYDLKTTVVSAAGSCGILLLLTGWTRERGRKIEQTLYKKWGGKPTTIWLRRSDPNLDPTTKDRYCQYLQSNITSWVIPSAEDEMRDPLSVDSRYDSAIRWLIEHTRDKGLYPLVFKELVSYGFRRNLYGMKPVGIIIIITTTLINLLLLTVIETTYTTEVAVNILLVGLVLTLFLWLFVVTEKWVRDSADAYVRALLASCDKRN